MRTPDQIFSNTTFNINTKHYTYIDCPVYILNEALQHHTKVFHKWKERTIIGIYIGKSPQYGSNISLVLNRLIGLISPQFHVIHDPTFAVFQQEKLKSTWQVLAGFTTQMEKNTYLEGEKSLA